MASLTFQPYVDKENVGALGLHQSKGVARAPLGKGGKVFQSDSRQSMVTPRKILGDVKNQGGNFHGKVQGTGLKPPLKASISKPKKGLQQHCVQPLGSRSGNIQQVKPKQIQGKPEVKKRPDIEDIEKMPVPTFNQIDEDDDFEDIFPKSERISTYITKLISWRPPCLFGIGPEEESEQSDHEVDIDIILEKPPNFPSSDNTDSLELCAEELLPENFDDIDIPSLEDLELQNEISLPLDDTIDISSSMGHLKIADSP